MKQVNTNVKSCETLAHIIMSYLLMFTVAYIKHKFNIKQITHLTAT